jgi:arylformamidase
MKNPTEYYSKQFNARDAIPDHPYIFTRWLKEAMQARRGHPVLLDLAYGETESERLDFFPANRGGAPLLIFIHGGWWRSMDKSDFSFIAPAYTMAGYNVALTNYTLAPKATLGQIVMEQMRAIAWLYRHAEQYDFDASRIVVSGHSAGGHLTAMMMAALWPTFAEDLPRDLIKGGVALSGLFDLEAVRHVDFVQADLKLTEEDVPVLSPALMPQAHDAPFLTAVGGLESDEFKRQSDILAQAWKKNFRGNVPMPDVNHMTICDAFGTPGNPLHEATLALLKEIETNPV